MWLKRLNSASTSAQYESCIRAFARVLSPRDFTHASTSDAIDFLRSLPLPHRRRARSGLSGFFSYLVRNKRCKQNPFKAIKPAELDKNVDQRVATGLLRSGRSAEQIASLTWRDLVAVVAEESLEADLRDAIVELLGNRFSAPAAFAQFAASAGLVVFEGATRIRK